MKKESVYGLVRERDQHRCQFPIARDKRGDTWRKCGDARFTEAHHRLIRKQGGEDTEENLILLCKTHHNWVHANPNEAGDLGLLVRNGDPQERHYWMESQIPEDGYDQDEGAAFEDASSDFPW